MFFIFNDALTLLYYNRRRTSCMFLGLKHFASIPNKDHPALPSQSIHQLLIAHLQQAWRLPQCLLRMVKPLFLLLTAKRCRRKVWSSRLLSKMLTDAEPCVNCGKTHSSPCKAILCEDCSKLHIPPCRYCKICQKHGHLATSCRFKIRPTRNPVFPPGHFYQGYKRWYDLGGASAAQIEVVLQESGIIFGDPKQKRKRRTRKKKHNRDGPTEDDASSPEGVGNGQSSLTTWERGKKI